MKMSIQLLKFYATVFIATAAVGTHAQARPSDALPFIQYTPTTTTESLLERYSQVHTKPNLYWQLTDEEWARFETIKKASPWSQWENNASPLALLAHYADSTEEKRRYARIAAELDTWRQYRVTEFQALYDKERSIVHKRYVEWFQTKTPTLASIKPYDKLRLFMDASECEAHCRSLMSRVLHTQAKIDIYLTGASTDEAIFKWAELAGIPVERVKTKEITLNHDQGLFQLVTSNLHLPAPKIPSLFRQVAGTDQVVAI